MELLVFRNVFTLGTTLGRLDIQYPGPLWYTEAGWVPNEFPGRLCTFGFSCEDPDRGLTSTMSLDELRRRKIPTKTAIPLGRYRVRRTWSNKWRRLVMEICAVPMFRGVRIHTGNDSDDTEGCLLPGLDRDLAAGKVLRSGRARDWLDQRVIECEARGMEVWIQVAREGEPLRELVDVDLVAA
jgi:hypothetical protein